MNIFWLDEDMQKCAEYHCDKHVGKMLMEAVQIMCTALEKHGYIDLPYKSTHHNHPAVVWAGDSAGNFKKLSLLATKLANEWEHRYFKPHASAEALKKVLIATNMNTELPFEPIIEYRPPLCMPEHLADPMSTPVQAYREYYNEKLSQWGKMSYTNRDIPEFLLGE